MEIATPLTPGDTDTRDINNKKLQQLTDDNLI